MLRRRTLSSIGVVFIGVLPALWGPWGAAIAFALLGALILAELTAMLRRIGSAILWPVALPLLLAALVAAAAGWPVWVFGLLLAAATLAPGCVLIFRTSLDGTLAAWLATTFVTLYLAVPLAHATLLRGLTGGPPAAGHWLVALQERLGFAHTTRGLAWFLLALVTTWLTDVGAFAVGTRFGRHKMLPAVSPHKTWEGFAGGVALAVLTALITNFAFGVGLHPAVAAGIGALIGLAAAVGDTAESLLKRQTGVKDTGTFIPGHGGVLDRMDSQLFVFVVVYYVARAVA